MRFRGISIKASRLEGQGSVTVRFRVKVRARSLGVKVEDLEIMSIRV